MSSRTHGGTLGGFPARSRGRAVRLLVAAALAVGVTGLVSISSASPATADGCYTWSGTLRQGANGEAVKQLQTRLAGWVDRDEILVVDGDFGGRTAAALKKFQSAYGLSSDGVAGPNTFNKIYSLQDNDCTPIHFTWSEFDKCADNYTGSSKATQAEAKRRTLQVMWQMEALRKKLGDNPLKITSGFRNDRCNDRAGGSSTSPHLYGAAGDIGSGPRTLCQIYNAARSAGFSGLLGPGYPGHDDHVHADNRHVYGKSPYRSASSC